MAATKTIPIVMVVGAPVQSGFVESLARPGGNATGLSGMDSEMAGKRLQMLRELIPGISTVAVLGTTPATNPYSGPFVADFRQAAAKLSLNIEPVLISGYEELEGAFAAMARARAQAFIVQDHFDPYRQILLELAGKHKLAYMSGTRETTLAGGLVSVSSNWLELFERAATYVDRILKGAKPGDTPVEQPMKFHVVLNMRTAQALGLTVSPSALAQVVLPRWALVALHESVGGTERKVGRCARAGPQNHLSSAQAQMACLCGVLQGVDHELCSGELWERPRHRSSSAESCCAYRPRKCSGSSRSPRQWGTNSSPLAGKFPSGGEVSAPSGVAGYPLTVCSQYLSDLRCVRRGAGAT
jgi:hypothetical protein